MSQSTSRTKLPSPREKTIKLNASKEFHERNTYASLSKPTILCSCTLSTYERKGVITLKYVDTFTKIDSQYQNVNTIMAPILTYNQYVESLQSLRHNCSFIVLASKFNNAESEVSLQDLRNIVYDYPKTILSSCTHNSVSRTININELDKTIINVLKSSVKIIEKLESEIDFKYLNENIKNFEDMHKKNSKLQQSLCATSNRFIQMFENKRVSLSGLEQAIKDQEVLSV